MQAAYRSIWCLCVLALAWTSVVAADDEDVADGQQCINASVIRSTRILDDANILFYVRGNAVYRNMLSRQCKGLLREGRFSYRRTTSSLCKHDFIRVLYATARGMEEGPACTLGNFYKVTEEEVELLLNPLPQQVPPVQLPPSEPEEVIEDVNES